MDKGNYGGAYEKEIEEALTNNGVNFNRNGRLDFYLIDEDVYIEVKQYHCERSNEQLASQDNIILVQGEKSAKLLIKAINCGFL